HSCRYGGEGGGGAFIETREDPSTELSSLAAERQRGAHLVERDRGRAGRHELQIVGQPRLERDLRGADQHFGRDAVERRWARAGRAVTQSRHCLTPTRATLGLVGKASESGESFDGIGTSAHGGKLGLYEGMG